MIAGTPYAKLLGVREITGDDETIVLLLPADPKLEGRQGFLYGGVIGSLLELACLDAIGRELGDPERRPKPIDMTFDFLRGGLMVDTFAQARLVRIGRQVVNADATCWQADRDRPIATGRMHLLLD